MTIKELEERTGMPRANIRFYEDEGLLKPIRLPNGYRDYSEEDILTLEKIKLLRQLHLDINTIRLVQNGRLSLEQAMFSQLNRLEGDKAVIERAVEVCRGIERSGVEYGALEPKVWLRELEAPAKPQLPPKEEPPKPTELQLHHWSHRAFHPWMRLFARSLDMAIYSLLFNTLFYLGMRWYGAADLPLIVDILADIGLLVFTFLLEPLWLHYVGWTPGKWIFGLKIRDKNGEKLSINQAWTRSWRVAQEGYGWNIPFWSLWKHWKGFKCCQDNEDCPWDADREYIYTCEDRRLYGLRWLAAEAVVIGLLLVVMLTSFMPLNRGDLTVEEFAENYNDRCKLYQEAAEGYPRLTEEGRWKAESEPENVHTVVIDIDPNGGEATGESRWLDPTYTVEDGRVTAVTFVMESDRSFVHVNYIRELLGFFALSGGVDGLNPFNYRTDSWVEGWSDMLEQVDYLDDFSYTYRGLRVEQTLEYTGYYVQDGWTQMHGLAVVYGEDNFCTRTVTISIVGSENQ